MDLLHNLTPSVSRSSPPPPAFRQATMPVSVAPGQVAPFTCGCQRKLLLFLSLFFFLFFYLLLGFLCCTAAFCHAPQRSTACRMPPSYLQLSPQLFVSYFQGGGKFSHAYCPARGKLWLFVAKLNATRCAVSLSTGGERQRKRGIKSLGGVNCKTNKRMRSSGIKEN